MSVGPLLRAAELYDPGRSVRALGMGNAFTAVVNDEWSLVYNPAGLSQVEGYYLSLLSLSTGLNGENALTTINDISNASGDIGQQLAAVTGNRIWLGYNGNVAIYMQNFGLNYFYDGFINPYVTNPAFTSLNIDYFMDQGYSIGMAFSPSQSISFGASFRRINRMGGMIPIGVDSLQSVTSQEISDTINSRGIGYGLDLGFIYRWDGPTPMRLGVAYRNLGNTSFQAAVGSTRSPGSIPAELSVGWTMDIEVPGLRITPALDYRHILKSEEALAKKIHMGLELDLPLIALRGGFSQGYYTYGLGLGLGPLDIELASYAVELGAYAGQIEDRRYMLEISMELGFDVNLDFSNFGSSGRRKLKQRR